MTTIIYYGPSLEMRERYLFRSGEAWLVKPNPARAWDENFGILKISVYTYYALFDLGIIDQLKELPHDGLLGDYEEGILLGEALPRAVDLLDGATKIIGNETRDVLCLTGVEPSDLEYRILIPPEESRKGLSDLSAFFLRAAGQGYGVQLWL